MDTLVRQAGAWLDMDDDAAVALVEGLAETVPEIESLFEFSILEPHQAAALKDQEIGRASCRERVYCEV